ncbi:MAG: tRNA-dihydrouridine synthase [Oceanospirillaceae bacterium]|nr:tRNA-dihydrouridine synthase [Oceanospirillaceae bacterium]
MKIVLAPMEGLVDPIMRDILTRLGGIDYCVTEFIRVSVRVLPPHIFRKTCPELDHGGKTAAGVPVHVQLLGSDPQMMAHNAARAARLGAPAIDLNFGCPSKGVNANRGGAILLETPNDVHDVVSAVRQAVPNDIPVTAKMRLGFKDKSLYLDNAAAIADAGAAHVTVHARTKVEGYKPPAHWEYIARIREYVKIPVIANGEIWNHDDYARCREVSGCSDVMIGRGQISQPDLSKVIKAERDGKPIEPIGWDVIVGFLLDLVAQSQHRMQPRYVHGRVKQWLHHLKRRFPEAKVLFDQVKVVNDLDLLKQMLLDEQVRAAQN